MEIAVFGAGCFWCIEAIFSQVEGIKDISVGYTGGHTKSPTYEEICKGNTGHAEVMRLEYDPSIVNYEDLLKIFWETHDPTTLNRQGNDIGTQYRSAIFYTDVFQKQKAEAYIKQLLAESKYKRITTSVEPMKVFYLAENYHQDFEKKNPNHPYIQSVSKARKLNFLKKYKIKN